VSGLREECQGLLVGVERGMCAMEGEAVACALHARNCARGGVRVEGMRRTEEGWCVRAEAGGCDAHGTRAP